jgi:hypothetical protein
VRNSRHERQADPRLTALLLLLLSVMTAARSRPTRNRSGMSPSKHGSTTNSRHSTRITSPSVMLSLPPYCAVCAFLTIRVRIREFEFVVLSTHLIIMPPPPPMLLLLLLLLC